jgi:hypothetical protein
MDDSFWNYRVLKRRTEEGKSYYGLVEVYYENDQPIGWTERDFVTCDEDEGAEGIVRTLMLMLKDAQKHPVLDEQELKTLSEFLKEKIDSLTPEDIEPIESIFSDVDAVEQAFGAQPNEA